MCCCEICGYWVAKSGDSVHDERITAALPIVPQISNPNNEKTWLDTLDKVFQSRFDRRNILAAAFAIFVNAEARLGNSGLEHKEAFRTALKQINAQLRQQCRINFGNQNGRIIDAFYHYQLSDLMDFTNELYSHPLNSFAVILRTVEEDIGDRRTVADVVFRRLVLLLFENVANTTLRQDNDTLLQSWYLDLVRKQSQNVGLATSIDDLLHYAFISYEQLCTLRIVTLAWQYVEENSKRAIYRCLT